MEEAFHINRLSPSLNSILLEWDPSDGPFEVKLFKEDELLSSVICDENNYVFEGLDQDSEYRVSVTTKGGKNEVRRVVTGNYRGLVINYLHPLDDCYKESGHFLGSPYIVKFQDQLFVTMDIFDSGGIEHGHNISFLFVSKDNGETWHYIRTFKPTQWGRLFIVEGKLYFIGNVLENPGIVLYESEDGYNWSEGVRIHDGLYKTSPTSVKILDDKFYICSTFVNDKGDHSACLLIGDIKANLMNPKAWKFTNTFMPDFSLGGDQTIHYAEEGCVVEFEKNIYVLMRFAYKTALMLKYEDGQLKFHKLVPLECGWCKFVIDKIDGIYYAIGNHTCYPRNVINFYKSKNLDEWELVKNIDDISFIEDIEHNGIQYPCFIKEKDELFILVRTALNGADTFHNSNAIVFKKIKF